MRLSSPRALALTLHSVRKFSCGFGVRFIADFSGFALTQQRGACGVPINHDLISRANLDVGWWRTDEVPTRAFDA